MQVLRIRKEFFEKECIRLESLAEDILREVTAWKEIRPKILKEKSIIMEIQTWWRNAITGDPDLMNKK